MSKNNYWNENGKYQKEYNKLYNSLVPDTGNCNTLEGEMLRATSRIYYRYFNDGDMVQETMEEYMRDSSALNAFGFLYHCHETRSICKELLKTQNDDEYENKLEELADFVISLLIDKDGKFYKSNVNMFDKEYLENLPVDFYEEYGCEEEED